MYIVGKVLKPQANKGAIKGEIITSFPEHFEELEHLYMNDNNDWQAYSIDWVRVSNRFVFIKLKGIDSIAEAETLRGRYLYIDREQLIEPGEDSFFIHDLIGLKVYDEDGGRIGSLENVLTYASNDVYVIKSKSGREYLIPATKEVVKQIDLQNRTMTIHVIEGLLD